MKKGHGQGNPQEGCMHKATKVNTAPACAGSTLRPVGVTGRAVSPPPHASSAGWQLCLLQDQLSTGRMLSQPRVHREPRQQPASPVQRGYGRLQFPEAVHKTEGSPRREKPGWQL